MVTKFSERHAGFAFQPFLYRIFGHHVINGEMFPYITDEIKKIKFFKPIVIIYHHSAIGAAVKIQKFFQLFFNTVHIVFQNLFRKQIALGRFTRRIANHTGSAANQSKWFMPCPLKMNECHYLHQVANMQRISGRIKTDVSGNHISKKLLFRSGHDILQHATPPQFFYKIHL